VRAQPDERRFSFQLARAYVEANKFDLAKPQLEKLSKDGYPIATTYLGFRRILGVRSVLVLSAGAVAQRRVRRNRILQRKGGKAVIPTMSSQSASPRTASISLLAATMEA
jgi:hypothetical protein